MFWWRNKILLFYYALHVLKVNFITKKFLHSQFHYGTVLSADRVVDLVSSVLSFSSFFTEVGF